jgi:circadian clock protein KaiC
MSDPHSLSDRLSTGIAGLDTIIGGGFPRNRLILLQGGPGAGKSTLSLQFLLEGVRAGECCLYVTLAETKAELQGVARSHGWSLEKLSIFEIKAGEDNLMAEEQYTAFHPSEVELGETVQHLLDQVERVKPVRLVIDSLAEMRLLARDPIRYRRQVAALKHFFVDRGCTVVLLDDSGERLGEHQFQTLAHGVITLERHTPAYGKERRRLQVVKLRGVEFHGGYHDFAIRKGGIVVYPCLVAAEHHREFSPDKVSSGLASLDALLGGGPEQGTSSLIIGPAGVGKSTLCLQYAKASAENGEHAAVYSFDEGLETIFLRSAALGVDVRKYVRDGRMTIEQIDPAALSPGEFIYRVRRAVEENGARVVVIDSLNGYLNAMPGEQFLVIQMHELLSYLAQQGVASFIVMAQHGLIGETMDSPVDLSYLADTVVLLRYFEHEGKVRKAISVLKKRGGPHEDSIRELQITPSGVRVGDPLMQFQGVLTGTPRYTGGAAPLLEERSARRES